MQGSVRGGQLHKQFACATLFTQAVLFAPAAFIRCFSAHSGDTEPREPATWRTRFVKFLVPEGEWE